MSSRLNDLEERAWQAFLHSHATVTRQLEVDLRKQHGLQLADYDILRRLSTGGGRLSMTELAQRVLAPISTLSRRVDGLVSAGYVVRERSPDNARYVIARLTPTGRRALRRAAITHLRGIRQHFTGQLSDRELVAVAGALERITGRHHEH